MSMPWGDRDVMRLCVTSAIGLVAITVAWYGISGSAYTGTQALWLNIGIAGAVISALGNAVWLMRGRREVGRRRVELVSSRQDEATIEPSPRVAVEYTLTMPLGMVRAEGMSRVHRADCPLVAGKSWEPANIGDGEPCGVCVP